MIIVKVSEGTYYIIWQYAVKLFLWSVDFKLATYPINQQSLHKTVITNSRHLCNGELKENNESLFIPNFHVVQIIRN